MMKVKIAVFGKKEMIARMSTLVDEQDDVDIVPFTYTRAVDTTQLIEKAFMCDIYLFTESLSYLYVKDKIEKKRLPHVQIAFDSYTILTSFYRLKNEHKQALDRLSIDILDEQHVNEVQRELNMNELEMYTYSFGDNDVLETDKIVKFHQRLWNEGKIDYALTSISEVEQHLIDLGIPTKSMIVPTLNIEQAIAQAKSIATFNQSKSAQIIVGNVRIKNFHAIKIEKGEFIAQEIMLKLYQTLLDFGLKTNASVLPDNNNQFMLFGTKDVLDHITNHYRDFPLLLEIEAALHIPVDIGFGLGLTAKQAEDNAKLAMDTCNSADDGRCYVVNERKDTIGPLGIKKHFNTSLLYQALIHKARLNNELSYNFIDFITIRNNEPFSSNDIATYYSVTKRSAERTINKLLSGEVIKVAGEERPYLRGRPRKLFTLNQL